MLKILVADDELEEAKRVRNILQNSGGYRNVKILSKVQYMKELLGYDIVVLDIVWIQPNSIPEDEQDIYFGFTGLRHLKTFSPKTIIILMSKRLFDLSDVGTIAEADGYFKKTLEGSKILEEIGKVITKEINVYLNLTEQTLLDAKANQFGLEPHSYEQLLDEICQVKQGIQQGSLDVKYQERFDKFLPALTGSNALIGLVNGLIKLFSCMP